MVAQGGVGADRAWSRDGFVPPPSNGVAADSHRLLCTALAWACRHARGLLVDPQPVGTARRGARHGDPGLGLPHSHGFQPGRCRRQLHFSFLFLDLPSGQSGPLCFRDGLGGEGDFFVENWQAARIGSLYGLFGLATYAVGMWIGTRSPVRPSGEGRDLLTPGLQTAWS